jgi:ParB/RepB/Spo0J family partition protein
LKPASVEEAVIATVARPPRKNLVTERGPMKIVPQRWRDGEGRVVEIMERSAGAFTACLAGSDPPQAAFTFLDFMPASSFDMVQADLDKLAVRKGWTSLDPLPADDDNDETKPARSKKSGHAANRGEAPVLDRGNTGASSLVPGALAETIKIPIDLVDPNPFQPRRDFAAEEIQALARSIAAEGLLQAPVSRCAGGRYQLALGERRLRACRLLGWEEIPLVVTELSDADMRRKGAAENAQRKDLNPIERAHEWQRLLKEGDYPTQQALAEALGVEQGTVSNAIRLLDLPEAWQRRIISGEISPRHARALLPWRDRPKVLDAVAARMARALKRHEDPVGSVSDFERDVVRAVHSVGRRIDSGRLEYDAKSGKHLPAFVPTAEQLARYEVVEARKEYGDGTAKIALNRKAYEKDRAAWIAKARQELKTTKNAKGTKGAPKEKSQGAKPPNKKRLEASAEAERAAYQSRLEDVWSNAWHWLVSQKVGELTDDVLLALVMIMFYQAEDAPHSEFWARALSSKGGKLARKPNGVCELVKAALAKPRATFERAAREAIAAEFWDGKKGPPRFGLLALDDLIAVAVKLLGVDFEAAWLAGELGPIYGQYFEGQPDEAALYALGEKLGIELPAKAKKPALVKALAAGMPEADGLECGPPLPPDLAEKWKAAKKGLRS